MGRALKISSDSGETWIAGASNALMGSVLISVSIEGESPGMIHVTGMNELDGERLSHTTWLESVDVESNSAFTVQFLETDTYTPPTKELATDSEEFLKLIAGFNEAVEKNPPRPRVIENNFPDSGITATLPDGEVIEAFFESDRCFMMLTFTWHKSHAEKCRVGLSSVSTHEAANRLDGKQWCDLNLSVGESILVKVR